VADQVERIEILPDLLRERRQQQAFGRLLVVDRLFTLRAVPAVEENDGDRGFGL